MASTGLEDVTLEIGALAQDDETEKRKRGIRRTAIAFGLIALFFYVGFIVLMVIRGSK